MPSLTVNVIKTERIAYSYNDARGQVFTTSSFGLVNGYVESFNSKLRDELLNSELFLHIDEFRYVAERWRMDYNHYRRQSSLSYMTPAEFTGLCEATGCIRSQKLALEVNEPCETLSQKGD